MPLCQGFVKYMFSTDIFRSFLFNLLSFVFLLLPKPLSPNDFSSLPSTLFLFSFISSFLSRPLSFLLFFRLPSFFLLFCLSPFFYSLHAFLSRNLRFYFVFSFLFSLFLLSPPFPSSFRQHLRFWFLVFRNISPLFSASQTTIMH